MTTKLSSHWLFLGFLGTQSIFQPTRCKQIKTQQSWNWNNRQPMQAWTRVYDPFLFVHLDPRCCYSELGYQRPASQVVDIRTSMELNAIVLSFLLDFMDYARGDTEAESLRIVSRDFQRSLYDVSLRPELIQFCMLLLFDRNHRRLENWENPVPEPWFHPMPKTQFGCRKDIPEFDQTGKSCLRRLLIANLDDIDVFICFLLVMTPLKSSMPYWCGPDSEDMKNEFEWYCLKQPALRTLRSYLRAMVQRTNIIFHWDTSFEKSDFGGVSIRHCLTWRFRPGCRDAEANFTVRRRLRGKHAAHHLYCANHLITIVGNPVSDKLWNKVLEHARMLQRHPM